SNDLLHNMCDVIVHRGPDDEGYYIDGNIGLGMRRLSIIDLQTGNQPIHNESKDIWIVCNGEIYNFHKLRAELERKGHKFYTRSDTEAIVHCYEEYGDECVSKLNGMFAFAIWDSKRRRLLLARDRLGIKPLFYTLSDGNLLFASEIKSILQDPTVKREVNLHALHNFLSLNYIPHPDTIFKDIYKLPPGNILVCENGQVQIKAYWDMRFGMEQGKEAEHAAGLSKRKREEEYAEGLREQLKESVRLRLLSDVPLGVLLSGGIDSSAITALMSSLVDEPIKTFSIGFEEKSFNELEYARIVAKQYGTDHHEMIVKPNAVELLPKLVWHFDEPFADSSAIPTYLVSKMAREHVTVVLSGEGSDEVFAGYETHAAYRAAELYSRIPRWIRKKLIRPIVHRLPVSTKKVSFDYKAKIFVDCDDFPAERRHYWWKLIFSEDAKKLLYSQEMQSREAFEDSFQEFAKYFDGTDAVDMLNKILYVDTKVYLANDILVKSDRSSMANSLELRVPMLDYKVVEFAASIPPGLKLNGFQKKYILKKAMEPLLPKQILYRKKKGFSIPASSWLRNELKDMVLEFLSPAELKRTGYFNPDYVKELLNQHFHGLKDNSRPIWGLLTFMLWHRTFMEQTELKGPRI
ncbi:MAG: asparagine synthase (glutamine-hydrolyzing), partial [Candidatus Poribacteria bacterium]